MFDERNSKNEFRQYLFIVVDGETFTGEAYSKQKHKYFFSNFFVAAGCKQQTNKEKKKKR